LLVVPIGIFPLPTNICLYFSLTLSLFRIKLSTESISSNGECCRCVRSSTRATFSSRMLVSMVQEPYCLYFVSICPCCSMTFAIDAVCRRRCLYSYTCTHLFGCSCLWGIPSWWYSIIQKCKFHLIILTAAATFPWNGNGSLIERSSSTHRDHV
jgi:hypothetical protein